MAGKNKPFRPLLVSYNKEEHKRIEKLIEEKLMLLDEASVWINNVFDRDDEKINMKKLHTNMVEHFYEIVLHVFSKVNQLGLSAEKLVEVKEIPISELVTIQEKYDKIKLQQPIKFVDNEPMIKLQKSDFETYTTNEIQNKRVIYGNQFIKAVNDLQNSLGIKVYPMPIAQATSRFITYDLRENKYMLNREVIFS
jgi:hypothetical protein|tara:strand:+ start:2269 stop:2853 length:585 start_codon:yes stop_codon:yes gene_type:complete